MDISSIWDSFVAAITPILPIIDWCAQGIIAICGLTIVFLLSHYKSNWGSIIGLAIQPFWMFTVIYHKQWVLLGSTVMYAIIFASALWKWRKCKRYRIEKT